MLKKILLCSIRFYWRVFSPCKWRCHCKFYLTCSQYALEAVEKYGAWRGGKLVPFHILRCNPFSKDGYDPVP